MDVASGLTAASQVIEILKQIKNLDASIDAVAYKEKLLELRENAFEARSALLDVKQELLENASTIAALEAQIKNLTSGSICPKCSSGTMKTIITKPHSMRSAANHGVQIWTKECDAEDCNHRDEIIHDPNGLLKK